MALVVLATSCTNAYRDAMDRGDSYAQLGRWDEAAQAYAEAVAIEPNEPEAQAKLRIARQQQSIMRTRRGFELLALHLPKDALGPFTEALRLDPLNIRAREGLDEAKRQVIALARTALSQSRNREAYELAHAVVVIDPGSAEATDVEAQARRAIYVAAVERAKAWEAQGQRALALIDYGEALEFEPWQTEAQTKANALRAALREEGTYIVAVGNFDGDSKSDDLGSDVSAAVLAKGFDPTLPIRFTDRMPKPTGYTIQGMRLGGIFRGYKLTRASTKSSRSCDYVCGTELVSNPAYTSAEETMRTTQQVLAAAEARLATARTAVGPAERARDSALQVRNNAKTELDRTERELRDCRAANTAPGACDTAEQARNRARSDFSAAEANLSAAENSLSQAQSELSAAQRDRDFRLGEAQQAKQAFEGTPAKVPVDKHCMYTYEVETVTLAADVECMLRGEGLYDTTAVLTQSVAGHAYHQDETFPAQSNVCAELAGGDPLQLPTEGQIKRELVDKAVTASQKELLAAFDRYRQNYLHQAQLAIADRRDNDAATNQIKFLLTLSNDERKTLGMPSVTAVSSMRGVDIFGVQLGVFGEILP